MAGCLGAGKAVLAVVALLLLGDAARDDGRPYCHPCPPAGAVVAVFTRTHELYLCRDGVAEARIRVALGRGGVGKRRRGDTKTPVGTYAIGEPRPSALYRTFIPIAYPTAEQASRGYTGSDLGFHGPPRGRRAPGAAKDLDWTFGCIGTGSDEEIARIARFVREARPVATIR